LKDLRRVAVWSSAVKYLIDSDSLGQAFGVEPMGINRPRSKERVSSEVVALENLRNWRQQFTDNPLDPEVIQKGLLTLSDIGESALMQAVKYGRKVEEIHESQKKVRDQLELVQAKLDTTISRFESSSTVHENENESVAEELKGLQLGLQEVKDMSRAIVNHFGIEVPTKSDK
jgi:hypothetical protein